MTHKKWITLAIYIALAIAALLCPEHLIADIALWFFGLLPIVHLLEFLIIRKMLLHVGPSMTHHFVQTMIFGYVHWLPIKQNSEQPH